MPMATPELQREYQRNWIAARRAAFFNGKECKKCGKKENLELHHIDPTTKVAHAIWSWSEKRRLAEIEKCIILCHDCHLEETRAWMKSQRKHGRSLYSYGCRCDICREAQRIHNIESHPGRKNKIN